MMSEQFTLAELRELAAKVAAAEAADDGAELAGIWLDLHGLEWVDMVDLAGAECTPAPVAAARIRELLAEDCEELGQDPAAFFS